MRIKVDIDEKTLRRVQRMTGQQKKSLAITQSLAQYLKSREQAGFIKRVLAGKTDYSRSNEELERGLGS